MHNEELARLRHDARLSRGAVTDLVQTWPHFDPSQLSAGLFRDWMNARTVVRNILLIERDCDVREAIAGVLRMHRWHVTAVVDAAEAVTTLHETPIPDLIMIDSAHTNSVRDLRDQTAAAGIQLKHVPVIAMVTTDHTPAGELLTVLKKPFEIGLLLTLIRSVGEPN